MPRPSVLISDWLPCTELGFESIRERAYARTIPALFSLHVWWARRPLVASAGAILASLLPPWSPALVEIHGDHSQLRTRNEYEEWFQRMCGILGDPAKAFDLIQRAKQTGERIPNPYTYPQAFRNSPSSEDLQLMHRLLEENWGHFPTVADPTAGGGSIPYEAIRYGLDVWANDLNPVAVAVLRSAVRIPALGGPDLVEDLKEWGSELCRRVEARLEDAFAVADPSERITAYIWARTVACPRTGKPVPLAPNWWLSKKDGGVALEVLTERDGRTLEEPLFQIVRGQQIDSRNATAGTTTRGVAISPWDYLTVDLDYIKAEGNAGRMGSVLCAVAVRTGKGRKFRLPTPTDLVAIETAESEFERLLPEWEAEDIIPDESIPLGNKTSDPHLYGIRTWRDMYSRRQLLAHGAFVEEYRRLIPEVRELIADQDRAEAVLALVGLLQGKAITHNSQQSRWDPGSHKVTNAFERHDFAFRWSTAESDAARSLYQGMLERVIKNVEEITRLLRPTDAASMTVADLDRPVPGAVFISLGSGGDMPWIDTQSVDLVCIDPPYYNNVMYAELADFFYVWEKRTLGHLWPDLFLDELTNKEDEAVANDARFEHAGNRRAELARVDYERKMTAIFVECRRILTDAGVMTVMFTHKKADAWDNLGQALLSAGFSIEASWPVHTESQQSLHQAKKNAASSTIYLVCRKRLGAQEEKTFFDSIEADVRHAAQQAYTRFSEFGMQGVDLLLATYGPTLAVISEHWPVYSSEPGSDGQSRLLRPDEALLVAQEEVIRLQRDRLIARHMEFDSLTDFWLLAWDTFGAREFPFDEARKLALAVGGIDIDEVTRSKLIKKKAGFVAVQQPKDRYRRDPDSELPGVNRERMVFPALVDALHTAMYVVDLDGAAAARTWLEQRGLTADARMQALVEAAVAAVPRVREKGELTVEEAVLLERLVVAAFPEISIPAEETLMEQEQLFDT